VGDIVVEGVVGCGLWVVIMVVAVVMCVDGGVSKAQEEFVVWKDR
jgi:hypothetical protein